MKLKKIMLFILTAAFFITVCGCERSDRETTRIVDVSRSDDMGGRITRAYLPIEKDNGDKFRLAYIDIDPYNETFRMLYYIIESLKADGWIAYDRLPFDPETDSDALALMNWLADNAKSEYMDFDKEAHYYTSLSTREEIYESLKQHVESKHIDAVLTMGTLPAKMAQEFDLDIPLLMYGVSDPIGSGLVKSAESSGDARYWAHVDSYAYSRQMQYYYDTFKFKNIGSVYGDEIVCALPDYRKAAQQNGFKITEYRLSRETFSSEYEYYNRLSEIYEKMISEDRIDAYILNTDVIPDAWQAAQMMKIFLDKKIPVLAQVGSAYVKSGAALLIVDPRDAEGTAPFAANIIGSVFNGSIPGDLEQEYISSPCLTLNLDAADRIEYNPPFEMLISCEKIIRTDDK